MPVIQCDIREGWTDEQKGRLGDDPDPNIRFQIWRDVSGRLGGDP